MRVKERLPSGKQRTIYNRVMWAITHLKKACLLESREKRGSYAITDEGRKVLTQNLSEVNVKFLTKYVSYRDFVHSEE
ncbi:MAG: winged helix-turn-helix domain-containing protein [Oscillospiraceae bacterium]|nr:winged helix-turn-helix domain-containing protein [Oscillospiraceae bacterium]